MIVAAAFLLAEAGSLALIARELRKAPEGYEDDQRLPHRPLGYGRVG